MKDGWAITHDPYTLPSDRRNLYVDLGAERLIGAERRGETIAVESVWSDDVGRDVMEDEKVELLVFDPTEEVIKRWVP